MNLYTANRKISTFYSKNEQKKIMREIIYPTSVNNKKILFYLLRSLKLVKSIKIKKAEKCICLIEKKRDIVFDKGNYIDKSWIDGIIYLVEYNKNDEKNYIYVAATSTLNTENIISLLKEKLHIQKILHIDEMNYCWIKRNWNT